MKLWICARNLGSTLFLITDLALTIPHEAGIIISIYRCGSWSWDKVTNLLTVTRLINGRTNLNLHLCIVTFVCPTRRYSLFWQLHGTISWALLKRQVTKWMRKPYWKAISHTVITVRASSGGGCASDGEGSFYLFKCFKDFGPHQICLISGTLGSWVSKVLLNMTFLDSQACLYKNTVKLCPHNGCWGNRYVWYHLGGVQICIKRMLRDDVGIILAQSKAAALRNLHSGWSWWQLQVSAKKISLCPRTWPPLLHLSSSKLSISTGEEPVSSLHHTTHFAFCELFSLLIFHVLISPQINGSVFGKEKLEILIHVFPSLFPWDLIKKVWRMRPGVSKPAPSQVVGSASNAPLSLFSLPLLFPSAAQRRDTTPSPWGSSLLWA